MKYLVTLLIALLTLTSCNRVSDEEIEFVETSNTLKAKPDLHYCTWEDCPHQGENMNQHEFVSKWMGGYPEMSDGWCVEMTHFMNPTWTYEQCEDYVMSGVE